MNYESEIKTFVKRTSRDKEIIAIYLFGSYPENFSNRSDIDICIIGKLKDSEKRKIIRDSPELFDISFFDELPVFIKVRIFKRGRELFVRDRKIIEDIIPIFF